MALSKIQLDLSIFKDRDGYSNTGRYIKCSCPNIDAHKNKDKNPSFVFYENSKVGKCFSCGFSISLADYAIKYKNIDPAQVLGLDMAYYETAILARAVERWARNKILQIKDSDTVAKWLVSRGLPKKVWKYFPIGYWAGGDDLVIFLSENTKEPHEVITKLVADIKISVVGNPERKFMTFNHHIEDEIPTSFQMRSIDEKFSFDYKDKESAEYKQFKDYGRRNYSIYDKLMVIKTSGKEDKKGKPKEIKTRGRGLFGVCDVNKAYVQSHLPQSITIVEGEFDSIQPKVQYLLHSEEKGVDLDEANEYYSGNVIAIGSTANAAGLKTLDIPSISRVNFCLDRDDSGAKGIVGCANEMKNKSQAVLTLPEGFKDPDEFCKKNGYEAWKKLYADALSFTDFFSERLEKELRADYDLENEILLNEARSHAISQIMVVENEVFIQDICRKLADPLKYYNKEIFFNDVNNLRLSQRGRESEDVFEENRNTYRNFWNNGKPSKKKLANFIVVIVNNFIVRSHDSNRKEVQIREVYLENEKGNRSKQFLLSSDIMVSPEKMKSFCLSLGYYNWLGTNDDLMQLWSMKEYYDTGKKIYQPDCMGYVQEHDLFILGDAVIKDGQIFYESEDDKIIWIDDTVGFRLQSISVDSEDVQEKNVPFIARNQSILQEGTRKIDVEKAHEICQKMPKALHDTVNEGTIEEQSRGFDALMGLGWAVSVLYKKEIVRQYSDFPFLFLAGEKKSGKSTFGRWITRAFGFDTEGESVQGTTMAAQQRKVHYYSSLPYWLDEYENTIPVKNLAPFHKSVYAQQTFSKVLKDNINRTISFNSNSTILFSGEHIPEDLGLKSRCIILRFDEYKRTKNKDKYNSLDTFSQRFPAFLVSVLMKKNPESGHLLIRNIIQTEKELTKCGYDDRSAKHYAICLEAYCLHFDYLAKEFREHIFSGSPMNQASESDSDIVSQVFDEIDRLVFNEKIPHAYFELRLFSPQEKATKLLSSPLQELRIIWKDCISSVNESRARQRLDTISKSNINTYIEQKPYVHRFPNGRIEYNCKVNGDTKYGMIFKLDEKSKPPSALITLARTIFNVKRTSDPENPMFRQYSTLDSPEQAAQE